MNEDLKAKEYSNYLSYFLNIFIFNFKRNFDIDYSKNDFLKDETFFKLILLYLRLYLEYEETYIFLSQNNFSLLKSIMENFINHIPHDEIHFKNNIQNIDLIFEISTKIFLKKKNCEEDSKIDIIKKSLLAQFNKTFLFNTSNFWKAFFQLKIKNEKGMDSLKIKTIKVIEIMVLYNFIISKDMDFSIDFITSCLTYNFNMKLIKRAVDEKIGDIFYNFIYTSKKKKKKIKILKISKTQKFISAIKLCLNRNFLTKEIFLDLLTISKTIKKNLSKILINHLLLNKSLNKTERKSLWFNFINFNPLKKIKKTQNFKRSQYKDINEQIEVDIVRTKQWNGKEYQEKIRSIIRNFFFELHCDYEYFQGFNYIVSFFYDFFLCEKNTTKIVDYISNSMIQVF